MSWKLINFTQRELAKHTDIIHKISDENQDHDVRCKVKKKKKKKNMWRSGQDGGSPFHDEILEAG